ncbi:MAG: response regulator [Pelobium sp.]
MASKFIRNLQIGFSISFILLLLSSVASFVSIKMLVKSQDMVEHTLDVLNTLDDIHLNLKDKVIGIRGLLLSKNDEFSKPYFNSQKATDTLLNKLQFLLSDNPIQIENANELTEEFSKYENILKGIVAQRNNGELITLQTLERGKNQLQIVDLVIYKMKNVERQLLKSRSQASNESSSLTPILLVLSTLISLIITLVFYFRIRNDFKEREKLQTQLIDKEKETTKNIVSIEGIAQKISEGDYTTRVEENAEGFLGKLSISLNTMAISLETSFDKIYNDEWLQKGLATINEKLVGNKTIDMVCHEALTHLINYGECQNGAIYLYEDGRLVLKATHGKEGYMKDSFQEGEGIIGQVFKDGKMKLLSNLNEESYHLSFSGAQLKLKNLLVLPILNEDTVVGVIELGCNEPFGEIDLDFYKGCLSSTGSAIIAAKSRRYIQNLLEETQTQTEELQAQHNELENMNAELEAQTHKLQASEEELKVQQEELLQANKELEERSKLLEEKNQLIANRNIEIQKKAEELALSTKYKSEFLANMSHELRTPLNSILLLSRLSAENPDGNLTEDQVESAKVIQSSGNGLLTLIDEILDLSKIEAGKMDVTYEMVSIDKVKNELKGLFAPVANQKNIDLKFNIDEKAYLLETDEIRLGQILKNLLSNAIKFTSKGYVSLHVAEENDNLIFTVKDTGIGIPKDKQHLIFEAFQQADGSTRRKFGGTGLGLSISRELVKLLGGSISVKSEPDHGSEFTVTLPKNKKVELITEIEQSVQKEETKGTTLFHSNEKFPSLISKIIPEEIEDDRSNIIKGDKVILIVEDDTVFAKTLLNYARKENYKGIVVVRGDLALPATLEYHPRAILLDIQLPIMDGWMIMEQLKSNSKTKHIPVHIMSSLQAKKESLLRGAVDFINKPFAIENMSSVFEKIEAALNKSPKKVLIVEENSKHASALSYFLGNFNISTEIKNNVAESTKTLQEKNVDCVILDMGVPYETAYETLEVIRQSPGLENLPIIIFTGKNISKTEELKIKKYADSIVVKTAHSYQRILDEVGLFLHLVGDDETPKPENSFKKLGILTEVIKNKTVLIADDDVRNIFSLSKALEKHQMKVISAIDGKEALEKLNENPEIDVVLMDIMMPELDGYETISAIRKNPKHKKLPIIAVTAKAMMGDREKCIKVGASDYISKPVDIDQLLSLLRVWLYQV